MVAYVRPNKHLRNLLAIAPFIPKSNGSFEPGGRSNVNKIWRQV